MAKAKKGSSSTPATQVLTAAAISHTLHPYDHDADATHFGAEAAEKLGVDPATIFKTLVVTDGSGLAVAVVPVSSQLDLKAMATALGAKKVTMADPQVAARSSGYVVGGISPIGQRTPLPTVIDSSAQRLELIMVSAGRRGLQVQLSPADLAQTTGASYAPIGR
ncbi:Cys-tRNA(Pro) deacylase [Microlunatus sp. Y2014]|uniref:Cys-tRNA(Pro) deacylase n=1 Tax=Microlunatus sp. Y2014 TaxID=3418488 RepID=UPI003DA7144F